MSKKIFKTLAITLGLIVLCTTCLYAGSQLQPVTANLNYGLSVAMDDKVLDMRDAGGNKVIPITYNDTTYLPVRAIGEALGIEVGWDQDTQCVLLDGSKVPAGLSRQGDNGNFERKYNESDVTMMAELMYCEARGLTNNELAAVGWVVLNRVDASGFPNTISGVIKEKNQFSHYYGAPTKNDDGTDIKVVAREVLDTWSAEKAGVSYGNRILPKEYLYFHGSGGHNWFKKTLNSNDLYRVH